VKITAAKVFEVAFAEMMAGPEQSTGRLWEVFCGHLQRAVAVTGQGMAFHMRHQAENEPELVLNLLSHGPVEKGLDVTAGGAEYLNLAIDGAGIAVAADSFAALEQRIEREKRTTWVEVWDAVRHNFEGAEYLRRMLGKSSRYGGDESGPGNTWGGRISGLFSGEVRRLNSLYPGYNFIPGWFSWANTIELGKAVGATPNGRKGGEPINHGANPLPKFRPDGAVTALCNIIAAIQPGYGNTAPVQLELDPGISAGGEATHKIADLIRTMFNQGATLLNINIINRKKILAAHKDPEKFPELVVRVTGFTAYFSMLSPDFRQLVVDRIISKGDF
jgi:formate C-acetyltransferase